MGQTPGDEKHNEPSLELPSLSLPGFGRRKKSRQQDLQQPEPETEQPSTPEAETAALPEVHEPPVPVGEPAPRDEPPAAPVRRRARKERKEPREAPRIPGRVAAAVTGLVVGAAGGVATYGAMEGCEAVRGVSTCGGAPGFFILVAILALMVLLGSLLLKAFRVSDTGSTSFLAVGVVAVVAMLVLLDVIFEPAMFVVIPVLSALAFLLAHWVTTHFDEEATGLRR